MSLEVKKDFKIYIPKILSFLLIVILAAIVIKLALWENNYYKEKEGSARDVSALVSGVDDTEVSDEVVTEEQQREYTVADDMPRYLTIKKIGVKNARIFSVGENSRGQMETPKTNYDAAWYNRSAIPGNGGTAILNGHNGGPSAYGIFKKLDTLKKGDEIIIEMGDGKKYSYEVYDNQTIPLEEANKKMSMLQVSPVKGMESISIITCTGEYSLKQKTYLSRQYLRAVRNDSMGDEK